MMAEYRLQLQRRFRKQESFAATYSPPYTCFFGTVAGWLDRAHDPLVQWLLQAGSGRDPFDIPLLLAAVLHREVLSGAPSAAALARYYPTTGGDLSCRRDNYEMSLRQAIWERRDALVPFIQTATVQTNETGRGLIWLWPLLFARWEAVHLVDLGASAGLNLVAEKRAYRLVEANEETVLADLGQADPVQFVVRSQGYDATLAPVDMALPRILSRIGADIAPFFLDSVEAEQTLAAYVWGDQVSRLERLREGMAALREVGRSRAPVQLHAVALPDELPAFLRYHVPAVPAAPVVLYNTYITVYLPDRGRSLRQHIAEWAAGQARPVLWLQWEPFWDSPQESPEYGWCAWTADLWQRGNHSSWHLAWVHPHGIDTQWEPGASQWAAEARVLA